MTRDLEDEIVQRIGLNTFLTAWGAVGAILLVYIFGKTLFDVIAVIILWVAVWIPLDLVWIRFEAKRSRPRVEQLESELSQLRSSSEAERTRIVAEYESREKLTDDWRYLQTQALSYTRDFLQQHGNMLWDEPPMTRGKLTTFIRFNLDAMCFMLREDAHRRAVHQPIPTVIVKATFFEYCANHAGIGKTAGFELRRLTYSYPSTVQPGCSVFDSFRDSESTAVQAVINDTFYSFDDVKKRTQDKTEPWKTMYDGQLSAYNSLICFPVAIGARGTPGRRELGVITIDTNFPSYFPYYKMDRDLVTFYNELLTPLKHLIVLAFSRHIRDTQATSSRLPSERQAHLDDVGPPPDSAAGS